MDDENSVERTWTALPYPCIAWLVIGAIVGGTYAILAPPFSAPDEYAHLQRAYSCSHGHVYAKRCGDSFVGDELPASLRELYRDFTPDVHLPYQFSKAQMRLAATRLLDPHRREELDHRNTALFSPVPYVPAALTFAALRQWKATPLQMFYLGRAVLLASYLVLVSLAIWIIPIQKWTMLLVATMPLPLYVASSLSADTITNGLAFLSIALCLRYALRVENVTRKDLIVLCAVFCLLASCKQFYLLLVLLSFVIPRRKFGGTGRYLLAMLGIVVLPVVLNLAWMRSVQPLYVPIMPGVDPPAQLLYILAHPWQYVVKLYGALHGLGIYRDMVGVLGWYDVLLVPGSLYSIYWLALIVTAFFDSAEPWQLNWRIRGVLLVICFATVLCISTAIYLSVATVGGPVLWGLQSRYFLPVLPLFLFCLRGPAGKWSITRNLAPIVVLPIVSFASVATVFTLMQRYYW